jgi:hypothetical protein
MQGNRAAESEVFLATYVVDRDTVAAYQRLHPRASWAAAQVEGPRMLRRREVQAQLRVLGAPEIAPGSRIELLRAAHVQLQTVALCCRYCHGRDHGHQLTNAELAEAERAHDAMQEKLRQAKRRAGLAYMPRPFHPRGGGGFDPRRPPNPTCPNCHGGGVPHLAALDTVSGHASVVGGRAKRGARHQR